MANLRDLIPAFFVGPNGEPLTQDQIEQRQAVAASLLQQATDTSPNAGGWASVLAKGVQGGMAGYKNRQADKAIADNTEYNSGLLGSLFSGQAPASATPAYPASVAAGGSGTAPSAVNVPSEVKDGIVQSASALGIDPEDLATAISYETGGTFDPTKAGPTTQWGQHRGLIQFGEPQARQYGVDWSNPVGSQLGPNGAVVKYLRDRGVKPGMGMLDIYSTINAGAPGKYNASDANNGGAPGTVRDKVEQQMQGHRARARALFSASLDNGSPMQMASTDSGAEMAQAALLPATPNPNPTVAEALALPGASQGIGGVAYEQVPPTGNVAPQQPVDPALATQMASLPADAGAQVASGNPNGIIDLGAGSPGEIRQGPDGQSYQLVETAGMAGANGPQGWVRVNTQYQPTNADFTSSPQLSTAPDVPFVQADGSPSPVAAALAFPPAPQGAPTNTAPVQQPGYLDNAPTSSVAEALLPLRAQADPNDRMVADAAHTRQPTMAELQSAGIAAPQQVAQAQPDQSMQLQRVLADPRASPQTKQVALGLLQRQQSVADREAAAVREQQNWVAQQNYQKQMQDQDPLRQAQIRKAEVDARNAEANPRGEETFYGNPIAVNGPNGIQYGQIGSKGTFKPIELQEGQTFAPPTKQIDTGTELLTINQAGEVIARVPKQNRQAASETAGGKIEGETEAAQRLAAPADIQAGQNALDLLKQIKEDPNLPTSVGLYSYASGLRGSPQYDFNNMVEQAKGGAFQAAIQQMRGLGSLSNAEGEAATRAVTRMNTATSEKAFRSALDDYEKIVKQGIAKAETRLKGGGGAAQQSAAPAATAPVRRKFNPETGKIE